MGKRKPVYPYTEDWEKEVPELTEEQEDYVAQILHSLGRTERSVRKMREMIEEDYRILFPTEDSNGDS